MVKSKLGIKSVKKPVTKAEIEKARKKVLKEQKRYRELMKRKRANR